MLYLVVIGLARLGAEIVMGCWRKSRTGCSCTGHVGGVFSAAKRVPAAGRAAFGGARRPYKPSPSSQASGST